MRNRAIALFIVSLLGLMAVRAAHPETSGAQSNYIFRFNTGISAVFLSPPGSGGMTFASQQSLNLGSCTTTEKINGPISCAVNCGGDSVCLLEVSGPPSAGVTDVMEKVSETPITGATPAPSQAPAVGYRSGIGDWSQVLPDETTSGRIAAYNTAE